MPYKFSRNKGPKSNSNENSTGKNEDGIAVHVPWRYRKMEIKYSKLGMDDFDYDQYNRTSFSGLDMSLPNSYCNPMLQVCFHHRMIECVYPLLEKKICVE